MDETVNGYFALLDARDEQVWSVPNPDIIDPNPNPTLKPQPIHVLFATNPDAVFTLDTSYIV